MHPLVLESREDLAILAKHLHSYPRAHEILLDQKRAARQHRAGDRLDVFTPPHFAHYVPSVGDLRRNRRGGLQNQRHPETPGQVLDLGRRAGRRLLWQRDRKALGQLVGLALVEAPLECGFVRNAQVRPPAQFAAMPVDRQHRRIVTRNHRIEPRIPGAAGSAPPATFRPAANNAGFRAPPGGIATAVPASPTPPRPRGPPPRPARATGLR